MSTKRKLKLIYEAVDHNLFKRGDVGAARVRVASYGVTKPFVLFLSSLWPYKNCDGLLRAWAVARGQLGDRQLVIVGHLRDKDYVASLRSLAAELGIAGDLNFVGGVSLAETVPFYQAADVYVNPSFNETFSLPILEAMACGCPVVVSDISCLPETAGRSRIVVRPQRPGFDGTCNCRCGRAWQGSLARRWTAASWPVHVGGDCGGDSRRVS